MVDKKVFDEFIDMLEYVATNISGLTRPNSDKTYEKMCDLENIVYNTDNIVMVDNSCNNYSYRIPAPTEKRRRKPARRSFLQRHFWKCH